jgi:hypothetical protein
MIIIKNLKRNWDKYNANKTIIDWIKFASKLEANRYLYFKKKWIKIIELQPKFSLQPKFEYEWVKYREIKYISDFLIKIWDMLVIIDMKWMLLPEYQLKKKLFLYKIWEFEKEFGVKLKFIEAKSIKELDLKLSKL